MYRKHLICIEILLEVLDARSKAATWTVTVKDLGASGIDPDQCDWRSNELLAATACSLHKALFLMTAFIVVKSSLCATVQS